MSAGMVKLQFLTVYSVQQQPTRLYVSILVPIPVPPQRVILVRLVQRRLVNKQTEQRLQFVQIFASFSGLFHVLLSCVDCTGVSVTVPGRQTISVRF
jgi:hypothetical protein